MIFLFKKTSKYIQVYSLVGCEEKSGVVIDCDQQN